ncbi:MAG: hypothetical protein ACI9TY_001707 [Alphaproteobacteria bacterium]|jgi:hypothetical protein
MKKYIVLSVLAATLIAYNYKYYGDLKAVEKTTNAPISKVKTLLYHADSSILIMNSFSNNKCNISFTGNCELEGMEIDIKFHGLVFKNLPINYGIYGAEKLVGFVFQLTLVSEKLSFWTKPQKLLKLVLHNIFGILLSMQTCKIWC